MFEELENKLSLNSAIYRIGRLIGLTEEQDAIAQCILRDLERLRRAIEDDHRGLE